MVLYPLPELCRRPDEHLLLRLGDIVFPDSVRRYPGERGLRLWVEGKPDAVTHTAALDRFHTLLGLLRVLRADAGELCEEHGDPAHDDDAEDGETGRGTDGASDRPDLEPDMEDFARQAQIAIGTSPYARNALWLYGRANRTAADYYMVHEYALMEFGSQKAVRETLDVSRREQRKLRTSARSLFPVGAQADADAGVVPWPLDNQRHFCRRLLDRWIRQAAAARDG